MYEFLEVQWLYIIQCVHQDFPAHFESIPWPFSREWCFMCPLVALTSAIPAEGLHSVVTFAKSKEVLRQLTLIRIPSSLSLQEYWKSIRLITINIERTVMDWLHSTFFFIGTVSIQMSKKFEAKESCHSADHFAPSTINDR